MSAPRPPSPAVARAIEETEARATLADSHVAAWYFNAFAAARIHEWERATGRARAALANDMMRRASWLMSVGRPLPPPLRNWLAGRLALAATTGDASVAFGQRRGRGGRQPREDRHLEVAALVHTIREGMGWSGHRAARVAGQILHCTAKHAARTEREVRARWLVDKATVHQPTSPNDTGDVTSIGGANRRVAVTLRLRSSPLVRTVIFLDEHLAKVPSLKAWGESFLGD